jgi:hypothetical protein
MIKLKLFMAISILAQLGIANASPEEDVAKAISKIYDKPDQKVVTNPVAVVDKFAIADWTQGNRGGRALMKNINGQWAITACGADGIKELKNLKDAGIPIKTAEALIIKLNQLEKAEDPKRLKMFSLFGTKDDPKNKEKSHHDHEHHHQH